MTHAHPRPAVAGPTSTPVDLTTCLRRTGNGEQDAFAELYDATAGRAFGVALKVLGDPSHAEDVTQEAYLDIWRNARRFDPARGNALGWIFMIVHGAAVNRVRSSQKRTAREMNDYLRSVPDRDEQDITSKMAVASLEGRRVREALTQLSPIQRQAIELAYFGGQTHAEVAQVLGVPLGTAKARIRDGLHRLRSVMGASE